MVWRWASGLASVLTRCVTRGGPPTLSGSRLRDELQPQQPPASRRWVSVAGAQPVVPAPPQSGASWPGLQRLFGSPVAAEWMGALGPQTCPRPSPAPAGEGWVPAPRPAAPGPLVSGSENHGLFKLKSDGLGPEGNRTGASYCADALVFSHLNKNNSYV